MISLAFRALRSLFFLVLAFVLGSAYAYAVGVPPLVPVLAVMAAGLFLGSVMPSGVAAGTGVSFLGVQSTDEQRAVYNLLEKEMAAIGPEAFATRGSLRLEVVGGAKNRYRFNVLQDEGNPLPSERRLARTDAFQVDRVGVFLSKVWLPGELTDEEKLQAARNGATFDECGKTLVSYPSPFVFQTFDELEAARSILNAGVLSIEIDKVKWLEQYDAHASRYVDTAQAGAITSGEYAADAWRDEQTMKRMVPTFRFNGGSSNVVELSVNCAIDFTGGAWTDLGGETPVTVDATSTRIVLVFDGWYLANAGEFLGRSRP